METALYSLRKTYDNVDAFQTIAPIKILPHCICCFLRVQADKKKKTFSYCLQDNKTMVTTSVFLYNLRLNTKYLSKYVNLTHKMKNWPIV